MQLDEFVSIEDLPAGCGGVYACLGEDGRPLYIGQSGLITDRITTHRRTKKWWKDVARVVATPLAQGDARLDLETRLILDWRPRHNRWIRVGLRVDGSLYEQQWLGTQGYSKKKKTSRK